MGALFAIIGSVFTAIYTLVTVRKSNGQTVAATVRNEQYGPPAPSALIRIDQNDHDVLARTLWGEARSEGARGMQAVANVIMNRYKQAQRNSAVAKAWGRTIAEICQKPYQFSAWLASDPNRMKMMTVGTSDPQFRMALDIAAKAIRGQLADITGGADHYHTKGTVVAWSQGETPESVIGKHEFYDV